MWSRRRSLRVFQILERILGTRLPVVAACDCPKHLLFVACGKRSVQPELTADGEIDNVDDGSSQPWKSDASKRGSGNVEVGARGFARGVS